MQSIEMSTLTIVGLSLSVCGVCPYASLVDKKKAAWDKTASFYHPERS